MISSVYIRVRRARSFVLFCMAVSVWACPWLPTFAAEPGVRLTATPEYRLSRPGVADDSGWRQGKYRFRIADESILQLRTRMAGHGCAAPALYFGLADQSLEVRIDGSLVYSSGEVDEGAAGVNDWPRSFHMIPLEPTGGQTRELELRFYSDSGHIGILYDAPILGCHDDLILRIIREDALRFGIGCFSLLTSLIAMGVSFRVRRLAAVRSFSFLCLCLGLFIISNRTLRIQYIFFDSRDFWFTLETLSAYLTPPALIPFVRSSIGRSRDIDLLLWFSVAAFVLIIGMTLSGFPAYRHINYHYGAALFSLAWLLFCALRAPARDSHTSRFTFAGLLVFALAVSYDILGNLGFWPWSHQILTYGFFVMLLIQAAGTTRRNRAIETQVQSYQRELEAANRQLQEYNKSLEGRVRRRTEWLRNSLKDVNRLRKRQESDYFLTARIMEPTRFRDLQHGRVNVTGYIEQKKKYSFNDWTGDIGGDVCMAHPLHFESGVWVFFMNGDAMGKSLQGAGGAIVLATSMQTIVNRHRRAFSETSPDAWLQSSYLELQEIFSPFAGKMTVTLVMAALHVDTGCCLFINAEHPPGILLRGGEARELEGEISPAIGTLDDRPSATIHEFHMAPDDMLLFGSDGREDLLVKEDGKARRISIADRFAPIVAACAGDLERIAAEVESNGELADDLSLLRVHYS